LAHCAAVSRIERCSSISLTGFGGLPIGFFGISINPLSVIQKVLQFIAYCDSINYMQLTYKFRLRDTCDSELTRQARAVNFVWNYCNETQQQAVKRKRKWLTWHDLQKLTAGSSKELDIHAHTIQQVCQTYDRNRAAKKKAWLRWRVSNPKSPKRSLGWVPFNKGHVAFCDGAFVFRGREYRAWVSRELKEGQTFGAGSFSQDSRGHWYINLPVEVESLVSVGSDPIGIDLGLKDLATISTGEKIEHPRWYRKMESRIAVAQRAKKKKQVRQMHAKVKAQRNDHLHKVSTRLVQSHGAIFVGNVNASGLAKTNMAKSVFDAGWSAFRNQLEYKAIRHQVVFREVNEAYSTQTCSQCASIEGPKGVAGLGIRQWRCSCGVEHDRDTNAAKNIARRGLASLEVGASA
jgi:putative transposase